MTINDIIEEREIKEILHFTTNKGITGILAMKSVLSRKHLKAEEYLEHILKLNCLDRSRDIKWHDYVNLSISSINKRLFGISTDQWHSLMDGWWCILSFSPEILTHSDVVFCTTNNAYNRVVKRGEGAVGLNELFADKVIEYESRTLASRGSLTLPSQPTCSQAEVLYPQKLPLEHLQCIYVKESDNASAIESQFSLYPGGHVVECIEKPELFS
jgi:hypothetical protein